MITAAEPPAFVWMTPDIDRYRGSFGHAVDLLANSGVATRFVLERLTEERGARCRIRAIRQGEHFEAMLFGADGVERNVVADTDRWPALTPRAALECTDGLGNALVTPVACGNVSFERVPPGSGLALLPSDIALAAPTVWPEFASSGSWLPWAAGWNADAFPERIAGVGGAFGSGGAMVPQAVASVAEPSSIGALLAALILFFVARLANGSAPARFGNSVRSRAWPMPIKAVGHRTEKSQ